MDDKIQLSKLSMMKHERSADSLEATKQAAKTIDQMLRANQLSASAEKLLAEAEDNSAMGIQIKTKRLEPKKEVKTDKSRRAQESVLVRKDEADGLADGFSRRQGNREYRINPSLLSRLAEELGIGIHENATPDEIINFVRSQLTVEGRVLDVSIIDKAFEFLLETARVQIGTLSGDSKERLSIIAKKVEEAKARHFEANSIEIQVAQKIIGAVDAVSEKTGETVTDTLERYRDVVHNPPDLQTMRKFYEGKGYKAMVLELKGLSSYLGGNLKRVNLENPELYQLAAAARKMQALLGVFRQTKIHIPTMMTYLKVNGVLDLEAA